MQKCSQSRIAQFYTRLEMAKMFICFNVHSLFLYIILFVFLLKHFNSLLTARLYPALAVLFPLLNVQFCALYYTNDFRGMKHNNNKKRERKNILNYFLCKLCRILFFLSFTTLPSCAFHERKRRQQQRENEEGEASYNVPFL